MRASHVADPAPVRDRRPGSSWPATAIAAGIVVILSATALMGSKAGLLLVAGVVALALGVYAVISPVFATILLLVAMFLRLPIRSTAGLPVEAFLLAFAAAAVSTALWMDRTPDRLRGIGAVGWAMILYLMWNVDSMFAPHRYSAMDPIAGEPFSVSRLIIMGSFIPFAMYVVGRYVFDRPAAVRALLWAIMTLAAYSAAVSIMPRVAAGEPGCLLASQGLLRGSEQRGGLTVREVADAAHSQDGRLLLRVNRYGVHARQRAATRREEAHQ